MANLLTSSSLLLGTVVLLTMTLTPAFAKLKCKQGIQEYADIDAWKGTWKVQKFPDDPEDCDTDEPYCLDTLLFPFKGKVKVFRGCDEGAAIMRVYTDVFGLNEVDSKDWKPPPGLKGGKARDSDMDSCVTAAVNNNPDIGLTMMCFNGDDDRTTIRGPLDDQCVTSFRNDFKAVKTMGKADVPSEPWECGKRPKPKDGPKDDGSGPKDGGSGPKDGGSGPKDKQGAGEKGKKERNGHEHGHGGVGSLMPTMTSVFISTTIAAGFFLAYF